ncbi:hypothetical protein [Streptomyces sp. Ru73]|uniref:hypothetical protein n=1 Tax=Streptomyces sp. Ru73 TaxID=2080748 RepID=UPI0021564983|nr:hypothetical protein [Streptomyces sp. Ru73]
MNRAVRAEWGPLLAALRPAFRAGVPRAVPMTLTALALTAFCQFAQHQPWGYEAVQRLGAVRAGEPLWTGLLRTPLSLFVPALDLPVWGALAQILVVFGIAEAVLGRRRTLLIAYAASLAGTLYARLGVALGPDVPFGLPPGDGWVVDAGPSAAVVGLAVAVCWRYRAWTTGALVVAAMAAEAAVAPNLAGKEHLAAIIAVLAGCAVAEARAAWARWPRVSLPR